MIRFPARLRRANVFGASGEVKTEKLIKSIINCHLSVSESESTSFSINVALLGVRISELQNWHLNRKLEIPQVNTEIYV